MPWQLTTPVDTGDLDSVSYAEVKIVDMVHRANRSLIVIQLEYGNTVDGEWIRGTMPASKVNSHSIQGDDYTALVTGHKTLANELSYVAAKRALYEHLASQGVIDAGTVT